MVSCVLCFKMRTTDRPGKRACDRLPTLFLVGGPPLTAALKLAMQHLRKSGEHLARRALQSVFLGTMRTQNLEWLERFSLDRSCQLRQAPVGSLWHRCYKCPASAKLKRGCCHDFDLDIWLNRMPVGVAGTLCWRTHDPVRTFPSPSGTSTPSGRCIQATAPSGTGACGSWGLGVLNEERKFTAKLHGQLPGLHQDITLAESVDTLWYLRHLGGTFYTDS